MRIPKDISLASWIRGLYKEGKIYRFYKSREWLELRQRVLEAEHFECELCKQKEPAQYTRADCVHHVNEVRNRPDLALSMTYRDREGVHKNLLALCNQCHNDIHERYNGPKDNSEPLTPERW